MKRKRVVLASSGGHESLAAIARIVERHGADVVTLTLDVGQDENASAVRERALAVGASKAHVLDVRDEFARAYVATLLHAGAWRANDVGLNAALVRALIAEKLADVGAMEGADWLAHGFSDGTEACVQFERAVRACWPGCIVRSTSSFDGPVADVEPNAPSASGVRGGIHVRTTLCAHTVVIDRETPETGAAPSKVVAIDRCPDHPALVEIAFADGQPVAINRVDMPLVELIEAVATIAGDHGIGRSVSERRSKGGAVSTEVLEAPAVVVLAAAYESLARAALTPALLRTRKLLAARYTRLIREGEWHSDAREALDQFMSAAKKRVSGTVRLRLGRGRCTIVRGSTTLIQSNPSPTEPPRSAKPTPALWSETTSAVSH